MNPASLWRAAALVAACLLLPLSGAVAEDAAETCSVTGVRTDERPDPAGVPTRVTLGVLVADLISVDDVDQAMKVDLISVLRWNDPRLAAYAGCSVAKSSVWFPRFEILNSNQLLRELVARADQVEVGEGGSMRYVQRLRGAISTYHQLERFPFDSHQFQVRAVAFDYDAGDLLVEVDAAFTRLGDELDISDWDVASASGASEILHVDEFEATYSTFVLTIELSRKSAFYVWKVLLPMTLIVMMSWGVFWISPERFGPQVGLSATAMLTLIAFQFFVASVLPKLGYFTLLDKLLIGATTLVFLTLAQSILTVNLVAANRVELARRLDRICRWLFPLLFAGVWVVALA